MEDFIRLINKFLNLLWNLTIIKQWILVKLAIDSMFEH